jgi:IclR family KDG regulon transcriptional repressor
MNLHSAKYPIDTIIKAAAVLNALSESTDDLGVSALSKKLGIGASTIHRILDTLVEVGYVQRNNDTHRYRLGFGLFQIGLRLYKQYTIHPDVEHILKELASKTGETAKLGIIVNGKMVYLGVVESTNSLRFVTKAGDWAPVYCTAMGKVLVANLPERERITVLENSLPLQKLTPNTIDQKELLSVELENVRNSDYAIDDEEFVIGSRGIAVPVRDSDGFVKAAVSISGPSARLTIDILLDYLVSLKSTSLQLSQVIFI